MNLQIVKQNKDEAWLICPFHSHNGQAEKNPSLLLNFTGEFAGRYHCFACNADGKLKDLGINMKVTKTLKKREKKDWYSIWYGYLKKTPTQPMQRLANRWNISPTTLTRYWYIWMKDTYSHGFPIVNEYWQFIGIQKQYDNGRKINMKGSCLGLFAVTEAQRLNKTRRFFITEGLSDSNVCTDLGLDCVGRLNAKAVINRCIKFCINWVSKWRPIVIISDNDKVGIEGSRELQQGLILNGFKNVIVKVPGGSKDLRAFRDKYGKEYTKKWLLEN